MTRREIKDTLIEYAESEIGGELDLDEYVTSDLGTRASEALKEACDSMYEVTIDESKLDDIESLRDMLDECIDAVILNERETEY